MFAFSTSKWDGFLDQKLMIPIERYIWPYIDSLLLWSGIENCDGSGCFWQGGYSGLRVLKLYWLSPVAPTVCTYFVLCSDVNQVRKT